MYLYFNNEGKATTKIPHGEIIRQGNNINLYICFPLNFFDKNGLVQENFSVGIKFKLPDADKTITAELPMDFQGVKKFYKLKDSEITYDLIDGKNYLVYYRNITGVTDFYGDANGIVVFNELDENNTIINSTYPETFNFFIEKTVGYGNKSSNINLNQYKLLQNAISVVSKELERLKLLNTVFSVSYLPDVVYDAKNEKYNLHEFINKLYILNGNFIDVDTLPTEAIQINQVYKCENKYYRIKIINDEEYEFVEIVDFEITIGRIYKILEDGNWICINKNIREVIGKDGDTNLETLYGLKKYIELLTNKSGVGIIGVNELPQKPQPLPSAVGTEIGKVYVNTKLSDEKILELMDQLEINQYGEISDNNDFFYCFLELNNSNSLYKYLIIARLRKSAGDDFDGNCIFFEENNEAGDYTSKIIWCDEAFYNGCLESGWEGMVMEGPGWNLQNIPDGFIDFENFKIVEYYDISISLNMTFEEFAEHNHNLFVEMFFITPHGEISNVGIYRTSDNRYFNHNGEKYIEFSTNLHPQMNLSSNNLKATLSFNITVDGTEFFANEDCILDSNKLYYGYFYEIFGTFNLEYPKTSLIFRTYDLSAILGDTKGIFKFDSTYYTKYMVMSNIQISQGTIYTKPALMFGESPGEDITLYLKIYEIGSIE